MPALAFAAGVGLLPVLLFLLSLVWLDSYKLLSLGNIVKTILVGGLAAGLSALINSWLLQSTGMELTAYSRFVAPLVEEPLKAAILLFLIRTHRVGFLVDAAILGFAAGAGFALVENVVMLGALGDLRPLTWVVRGLGTALMHGGTTALFAIVARTLFGRSAALAFVPALAIAVGVHGAFNRFWIAPVTSTVLVLALLPPLFLVVFYRSERSLRAWLGTGFDAHVTLLEQIHSGEFRESRAGRHLQSLTEHFPGEVVADMLCYLRLHLELGIRAKGELMLRESGFGGEIGEQTRAKLEEFRYLEESIGPTGRLAMQPFVDRRGRELWQRYLLERT